MSPVIRAYGAYDFADVYDICVQTAESGGDARGRYASDELMPDVFAGPYVTLEPELAFVVDDDDDRVVGYLIATADTRRFVERVRAEWLPRFSSRYTHVDPPRSKEEHIVHMGFTPERMLIPEVDAYPAHFHVDLLPPVQGRGIGRMLIESLRMALHHRGVPGMHVTVDPANVAARRFYDAVGFAELPSGALGIRTS